MAKTKTRKELTVEIYIEVKTSSKYPDEKFYFPANKYNNLKEVSRDKNGSIIAITIKGKGDEDSFSSSPSIPELFYEHKHKLITPENIDAVLEIVIEKVEYFFGRYDLALLNTLVKKYNLGWEDIFEIDRNQKGFGFMGGTGCGQNIHHLTYDKVLGVKSGLEPKIEKLATTFFAGLLGERLKLRESKKYLRENIKEEDVYVTINAKPDCQRTVNYTKAHGFPLKGTKAENITCLKCAKKFGGSTPEIIEARKKELHNKLTGDRAGKIKKADEDEAKAREFFSSIKEYTDSGWASGSKTYREFRNFEPEIQAYADKYKLTYDRKTSKFTIKLGYKRAVIVEADVNDTAPIKAWIEARFK